MKNNNISYIILEGGDGVGKSTLNPYIYRKFNRKFTIETRGDISEYVYAKKYNRPMHKYEHGLPFLYVILIRDKLETTQMIIDRKTQSFVENISTEDELNTLDDQDLFIQAAKDLKDEYNIIVVDLSGCNIEQSVDKVCHAIEEYIQNNIKYDETMNMFNKMYELGCEKYDLIWRCIDNQPYLNNQMIMADFQYHNGMFETYTNKTIPHNLLFSAAYSKTNMTDINDFYDREIDFVYPINSKIKFRNKIWAYLQELLKHHIVLTTKTDYLQSLDMSNLAIFDKVFGDGYIKQLSRAKATVYSSRELAHIEMMTVRCYESVLADNIIFVDEKTDPQHKILTQIYKDDEEMIEQLTVNEHNISQKYEWIMSNDCVCYILTKQRQWYEKLLQDLAEYAPKLKKLTTEVIYES